MLARFRAGIPARGKEAAREGQAAGQSTNRRMPMLHKRKMHRKQSVQTAEGDST